MNFAERKKWPASPVWRAAHKKPVGGYVRGSKAAAAGELLPGPKQWPWWKMCAATIAFFVWALAVPGNPYLKDEASAIAALGAMLVSTLLNILTPIFERPAPV